MSSCSNTKYLTDNQSLLVKSKILCDAKDVPMEELESILKQKENQKSLFFFRFYTSVYNTFSKGKGNKFKKWMITHVGNEPILYDENLTDKSQDQLSQYMKNKGYFDAKVDKHIETINKKTKLVFTITSNSSYHLNEIQYNCTDTEILAIVKKHLKISNLVKGGNFDVQNLENERQRITKSLNRNGYYYFENHDITYEADSLIGNNQINLIVTINPPITENNDTTQVKLKHKKYTIRKTFVILDYDYKEVLKNKAVFLASLDTTALIQENTYLLCKGKPYVNPQVVINCDYIKNKEYYDANDVERTKLALAQNILFRQISVEFSNVPMEDSTADGMLDCFIEITPSTKQSYSFNLEGTNTGGDWGAQAKATYENKNLLHGAEIFNMKTRYSFEQNSWLKTEMTSKDFSSRVYGFDFSIISPKFLFPFVSNISSRRYGLRTFIKVGYSYQKIPSSYESPFRYLSFGYIYKNNKFLTQYFTPFEINGIQYINQTESFKTYINRHKVSKNYEDYYISSTNYTLIWQNKNAEKLSNFHFLKFMLEATGNTLYAYSKVTNREKVNGNYQMFNTTFAQYIKSDIDYRYNFVQAKEVSTVCRLFVGCAFPYGNNNYVPYLKQYFAGGSNSMRAWTSLGPGTYKDTNTSVINKSDIKLEANLEQRFPIFSFLNGAVFSDIGNIWSFNKINGINGTQFNSTFYKDLAVAVGIGLRPNFSFFVFRIDLAVKMRNPALDPSKRWLWAQRSFDKEQDMNLTIGIGYPF